MNVSFDNVNFTGPIFVVFGVVLILLATFSYLVTYLELFLKKDTRHDTRLARLFLVAGACILCLGLLIGWLFPSYL